MRRSLVPAAVAILLVAVLTSAMAAHEIPRSVTVQAFVKPEPGRMRVIVRVPLSAMRDVQWPETADGILDVERAQPLLIDAATQWIVPTLEIKEGTRNTPPPDAGVGPYLTPVGPLISFVRGGSQPCSREGLD